MTMRTQPIKDIIRAEGALAHLFERYGIDYCCHGDETLEAVCAKKDLDTDIILEEIEAMKLSRPYSYLHSDLWDEEFLIEYIVKNHHRYCRAAIPVILEQLAKVNKQDGERFPYLKLVIFLFQRAAREIEQHMRKEEMILFPYFRSLVSAREFSRRRPVAPFVTVDGPIARMEQEHDETAQFFAKIRALLNDFTIPQGAGITHAAVIKNIEAFTNDLHQHVHLENNVLFPRIIALEQMLDKRSKLTPSL
jgi:regulator of cell morphogenesis and NO signaling